MADHWQLWLSTGPLAVYLLMLASWHGARHPRVVWGPVDVALLAFGIGGLALLGPFGRTLMAVLIGKPTLLAWIALGSVMSLATLVASRGSWRRLVIYNVDTGVLEPALRACLDLLPTPYVRTLHGFEDKSQTHSVTFEVSPRTRTAVVEAFGPNAELMIHELEPRLQRQLRNIARRPSRVAWVLLLASSVCVMLPVLGWIMKQPAARQAIRTLLERLPGM